MTRSILGLLIIAAIFALVGDILSNLARISELREVKKQLRRYEEAFRSVKKVTYYETKIPEPGVKINVVDETKKDDLPKFGDE